MTVITLRNDEDDYNIYKLSIYIFTNSSSRHVRVCVCLSDVPFPCNFFEA